MSSDFYTNKSRVDVITGCEPGFKVYRTWPQVVAAIKRGERVIKTSRVNKVKNTYDALGRCLTVGVYANQFCRLLRDLGITDIRFGSPSYHLDTTNDTYTIYLPKQIKF